MAKTQDLKRRIRSIGNTRQLTRAMKMVSAAKLRRAQDRMLNARPFTHRAKAVLASAAARANPEIDPLFQDHGDQRNRIVVITGDRGLCGAFNHHIIRMAEGLANDLHDKEVFMTPVGKRGRDYFRRRNWDMPNEWVDVLRTVEFPLAAEIGNMLVDEYVERKVDRVYLVYNEFKSAIQARPTIDRLLPIEPQTFAEGQIAEDYLYEPDPQTLFGRLVPGYVRLRVFHALLESVAAEHAARMTAMENATNNAGELIDSLTLTMNRVRQASITTEIIEVVAGAAAAG